MGIVSVASFAGSIDLLPDYPQARLRLARGYTLSPADAGFLPRPTDRASNLTTPTGSLAPPRVAQVANLRYKRIRANCLFIAFDD
jgi:hypothetical protein